MHNGPVHAHEISGGWLPVGGVFRRVVALVLVLAAVGLLSVAVPTAGASDDSQVHVAVDGNGDVTPAAQALLLKMTAGRWSKTDAALREQFQDTVVGTLLPPAGPVMDWNAGSVQTRKVCHASLASCWFYTRDLTGVSAPQWPAWRSYWSGVSDGTCPGMAIACHFGSARKNVYVSNPVLDPYGSCSPLPPYVGMTRLSSVETTQGYCPYPNLFTGIHVSIWVLADSHGLTLVPGADDPGVEQDYVGPIPYDGAWVRNLGLLLADPENVGLRNWLCAQINPFACTDPTGVPRPAGPSGPQLWGGGSGPGGGATPNVPRCPAGDPVDCATGNLYERQSDVSVSGKGLDLDLTRTYNAQRAASSASAGLFGWGWSASWLDRIEIDPQTTQATVVGSDGSRTTFYPRGGAFDPAPWVQSRLERLGDGTYRYVMPDQQVWSFSSSGILLSKRDRNGNTTTVSSDGNGRPLTVTDPGGRTLSFTYNAGGRVERVDAPGARHVSFGYDGSGHLTSVTDVKGGEWGFEYDGSHRLTSMTDPRGAETSNVYDSADRVVLQTDPLDRVMTFDYQGSTTTVTDARGVVTERVFAENLPTQVTSAKGTSEETVKTIEYDSSGNPTRVTDERGSEWDYGYDSEGNRTSAQDPLGRTSSWTFDGARNVLTSTLPSGLVTTYTYDSAGNLETTSRTHSESGQTQTTTLGYDAAGQLTGRSDPLGHAWSYTYDNAGNLTAETSPLGNKTTYTYDAAGFVTSRVRPIGNTAGGTPSQQMTTYVRDAFGAATQVTDARGKVTTSVYDANGNLTDVTDRDGRHTHTVYDLLNRPASITRGDGSTLATSYDENGNVASQTDGQGKVTSYTYDRHDRVASMTDPLSRTTTLGYDQAGNRTTLTDASNRVTTWTYNVANELTLAHASSGSPADVSFTYTPDGLRAGMSDETGTTNWTYDSLNRLKTFKNANDQTVTYGYDLADRNLTIAYPPALVPGAPGGNPSTVATGTVTRGFDDDDRMVSVKDWGNRTTSYSYDPNSNISTIARPNATTATNLYDSNDAPVKITDTGGSFSRVDTYTRTDGQLLATQTETGTAAQPNPVYSYDQNVRLTSTGASAGQTYTYDGGDNPTKIVRASVTANQTFDDAHQLTTIKNAANATTATFAYNPQGERTSFTNTANGFVTTYAYDQAGRLRTFTGKDTAGAALTQTYGYDGLGTRRWRQAANVRTHHTWDPSGELALMIQDGSTSYIYGPEDVPIEQILSKGTVRYLHHDQLGSIRAATNQNRSVAAAYSYDPYGKQLTATGSGAAANAFRYAGQYTDTTGLQYLRARYYDPTTAQFLTRDPIEALTRQAYTYALDSPVNFRDPSGKFSNPLDIIDPCSGIRQTLRDAVGTIEEAAGDASDTTKAAAQEIGALATGESYCTAVVAGLGLAGAAVGPEGAAVGIVAGVSACAIDTIRGLNDLRAKR